jgi:molybdopterin converting factor small subunit
MAKVKVLFFGVLTEVCGLTEVSMDAVDMDELKLLLKKRYILLEQYNFVFALNQKMVKENLLLQDNDELALLPPFAGG